MVRSLKIVKLLL